MPKNADPTELALRATEQLRELVREAHGTIRSLQYEQRRAEKHVISVGPAVDAAIHDRVEEGLAQYRETLGAAITSATQAVYDRFDVIAAICLGEEASDVRKGLLPVSELIRRHLRVMCTCDFYDRAKGHTAHAFSCPVYQIVGRP